MRNVCRNWLFAIVACAVVYGCDTKANKKSAQSTTGPIVNTQDAGSDEEERAAADAGADPDMLAEPTPRTGLPPVAGSATRSDCHSFTEAGDGMCAGFLCGITQEQLAAELAPNARCRDTKYACNGNLDLVSTQCARSVLSTRFGESDDVVRPLIRDCIFEDDQARAHVEVDCVDCFIDALVCSSGPCLLECLSGNSPECDECARNNGCFDPVFTCSGLPNPF